MAVSAAILGCEGMSPSRAERAFFADAQPWGFILFARNIDNAAQVAALTAELRDVVGRDAPILIDQEGGRVQRLRGPVWRQWHPPLDQMARAGPAAMRLRYRLIAHELRAIGIDVNCAPTCDVAMRDTHPFLRNRCFGETAETVTRMARALSDGMADAGVLAVMKHMPGHGRGRVDSHFALPCSDADLATLEASDFAPFRALNDLPMGMTAHMLFPAIDDLPVTHSPRLIRDVIRGSIGFDGLLMSDDIGMNALGGAVVDRALRAQAAGCDLILHCNGDLAERRALAAALPPMGPEAQRRAGAALGHRRAAVPIDIPAREAELAALMEGRADG